VGGLGHHRLGDALTDPSRREQRADPGQVAVQSAGDPEAPRSVERRHLAHQHDLVGDTPPERDGIEPA
jgi:hypothetical protein